jgi:alginate O-acetyltransferase complex protein AlgI
MEEGQHLLLKGTAMAVDASVDAKKAPSLARDLGLGLGLVCLAGAFGLTFLARPLVPDWAWMWILAFVVFFALKFCTLLRRLGLPWSAGRLAGYLFLWPGMKPEPFFTSVRSQPLDWARIAREGGINVIAGSGLLWLVPHFLPTETPDWLRAWVGLIGIALVLHFGVFSLLAAFWRRAGVAVDPIFAHPTRASSLADFWGARWNRAFSDFARDLILKPMARRAGPRIAGLSVFLFSGLVHDLVISLPASGGYGLPTIYFLLQGALVLGEGTTVGRRLRREKPVLVRAFAWLAVLGPAPLLFHAPFLHRIVLPFLAAIGAA